MMEELIDVIEDLISDHWLKAVTAVGLTTLGWLVAHWRASRAWKKREFYERINFSLNSVVDGTLRIRTLCEKSCTEVFLNDFAVNQLMRLVDQTTPEDPCVPIPQKDSWYFLNAILNELSEQFALGLLRRDAGQSAESLDYLICLTNECDGELRTRKLRAMVIRRDLLLELPADPPRFESPHHRIRWQTLTQLQARYASEPWRFLEVELVV